jgi:hypothetical protein
MAKGNVGARWEISVNGVPRTYRLNKDIAIISAEFLKEHHPLGVVTVRDLKGIDPTIVIPTKILK